jgi:putative zinc finger protein
MDCAETRLSLGVYVLGAIDPAERAQVDAHLAGCRDCRDELAGLAGLPALLSRVGAEEAFALAESDGPPAGAATVTGGRGAHADDAPPRELLASVIDLTAARRRRRRVREALIGVAAAMIIAAGVFGGLRLGSSPAPATQASAQFPGPAGGPWQTASGQSQGMTATVQYRTMGWGLQLAAKVTGIPLGTRCEMWVLGPNGTRTMAASWVVDNNEGKVWYPASAAVSAPGVHGFTITVGTSASIPVTA